MINYTKEQLREFETLAQNGIPYGYAMLSLIYLHGCLSLNISSDAEKALGYAELACEIEEYYSTPKSRINDSRYAKGYGYYALGVLQVNADEEESGIKLLKKSQMYRNNFGINALGVCFTFGIGVEQNFTMGFLLRLESAELGNPYAQFVVGECYEKGEYGAEKDTEQAIFWYIEAAEKGHIGAKQKLEEQWVIEFKNSDNINGLFGQYTNNKAVAQSSTAIPQTIDRSYVDMGEVASRLKVFANALAKKPGEKPKKTEIPLYSLY